MADFVGRHVVFGFRPRNRMKKLAWGANGALVVAQGQEDSSLVNLGESLMAPLVGMARKLSWGGELCKRLPISQCEAESVATTAQSPSAALYFVLRGWATV
jgi:hypothetical protein